MKKRPGLALSLEKYKVEPWNQTGPLEHNSNVRQLTDVLWF